MTIDERTSQLFDSALARDPELQRSWEQAKPRARIAGALVRLRNALGYRQQDVADRLAMPQSNVARLERASGNPQTTDALTAYARACGMVLGLVFLKETEHGWMVAEATAVDDLPGADEFLRDLIETPAAAVEEPALARPAAVGESVAEADYKIDAPALRQKPRYHGY
ncbi:MAG TPA: helix-turn-helix domain-containing protein [Pseudolabrys sp.]|nr:helix-turn-helix domain-containing protein [Pseudolabrys sp.]